MDSESPTFQSRCIPVFLPWALEVTGAMLRLLAGYPIHRLPVVSGGKVVGMVSSADVMKLDAFRPKTGVPSDEYLTRVNTADLMSKPAITIRPDQSLIDAAHLMASHGIPALPVVDAEEQLLGILTTTDIIANACRRWRTSRAE